MKHKRLIIFFASLVLVAGVVSISKYINKNYYEIDTSFFKYVTSSTSVDSPDKKHLVFINIYKTTQNSEIAYLMGRVETWEKGRQYTDNSKTIFWQKIKSSSIKVITFHGVTLDNWIDVTWLDNENININGIIVNINHGYDYRRDWSTHQKPS